MHPSVKALDQKIITLKEEAALAIDTLKKVLKTRLDLVNRRAEKMAELIDDKSKETSDLDMRRANYKTTKEEYEQTRDLYEEMKLQQKPQREHLNSDQKTVTRVE